MSTQSLAGIVEILARFVEQAVVDNIGTVKVLVVGRGNGPKEMLGRELRVDGGRGGNGVGILMEMVVG